MDNRWSARLASRSYRVDELPDVGREEREIVALPIGQLERAFGFWPAYRA
ncbi:MAG: hypothetical protein K2Q25_07630 [Mycobacteriaceae bacterium]|nr:hypothetical protein [Mycobacteriaceae bacterium]